MPPPYTRRHRHTDAGGARGGGRGLSRGITKRAPAIKKTTKVVVVGKVGGKQQRKQPAGPSTVLIGPSTDIKLSAGAVANFLREGKPPVVKAISAANVNNAAKTLALTRNYIAEEGLDLCLLRRARTRAAAQP